MHVSKLLHKVFPKASIFLDIRISRALFAAVDSVVNGAYLTIASAGRGLSGPAQIKHKIKRMDRLFGNQRLQSNVLSYYRKMCLCLLKQKKRPLILVDWSRLSDCGSHHFLSASVPVGGRSLPLLEIAYTEQEQGTQKAHHDFLSLLKAILPKHCHPIIVTDAGFKNPWFKAVQRMGWDFIGRTSKTVQYYAAAPQQWQVMSLLMAKATRKATFMGKIIVAKTNPLTAYLFACKQPPKGRISKTLKGHKRRSALSKKYAKRAYTPWILMTSLSPKQHTAKQIIQAYQKRMQIEESFRDLKNDYNGLGLRYCGSQQTQRLTVALLIGAIARFILWCIGLSAKNNHLHHAYQANTIKHRNVLSVFSIGKQFIKNSTCKKSLVKLLIFFESNPLKSRVVEL